MRVPELALAGGHQCFWTAQAFFFMGALPLGYSLATNRVVISSGNLTVFTLLSAWCKRHLPFIFQSRILSHSMLVLDDDVHIYTVGSASHTLLQVALLWDGSALRRYHTCFLKLGYIAGNAVASSGLVIRVAECPLHMQYSQCCAIRNRSMALTGVLAGGRCRALNVLRQKA